VRSTVLVGGGRSPLSLGVMTSLWHFKHRTNYVAWFVTFGVLFAATGFYKIYPDHPLWLAWLFSPVMLIQGLASMDSQALGHIGLLLAILAGLLSSSWVLQCLLVLLWNRRRHDA